MQKRHNLLVRNEEDLTLLKNNANFNPLKIISIFIIDKSILIVSFLKKKKIFTH